MADQIIERDSSSSATSIVAIIAIVVLVLIGLFFIFRGRIFPGATTNQPGGLNVNVSLPGNTTPGGTGNNSGY